MKNSEKTAITALWLVIMYTGLWGSWTQRALAGDPEPAGEQRAQPSGSYDAIQATGEPSPALAPKTAQVLPASQAWRGFGIQYWGEEYTADALARAPHSPLIVEPSRIGAHVSPTCREEPFTRKDVMLMRRGGARPVLAYLNVGELARNRDYWVAMLGDACEKGGEAGAQAKDGGAAEQADWYGTAHGENELLSAYWTDAWQEILRRRVDDLLRAGFDGVFLDDVLHYYHWGTDERLRKVSTARGGPQSMVAAASAMMQLVVDLADYARSGATGAEPDFRVVVNGAPYIGWDASPGHQSPKAEAATLYADYLERIDAILIENVLIRDGGSGIVQVLSEEFLQRGKPVLAVEYWSAAEAKSEADFDDFRERVEKAAEAHGFAAYATADGLFDRLYPPLGQPTRGEPGAARHAAEAAGTKD